jgi:acetyltransferase-like isoleucine patch superfamily enzyme
MTGPSAHVHPDAVISVAPGAELVLGAGCRIAGKARVVCRERIEIGEDTVLEEDVAVLDCAPRIDDVERPIRLQGHTTSPVRIGARVVLHRGAVVHPGVTIGDDAVVGHHAVVTHDVPAGTSVEGIPARPVAERRRPGER